MNVKKLASGRYQVRWRDETGKQRSRNERTKELAYDFIRKEEQRKKRTAGASPTVQALINDFKQSTQWQNLHGPTQAIYCTLFELWFDLIDDVTLSDLSPRRVSEWLAEMKEKKDRYKKGAKRQNFRKELQLLRTLLSWYESQFDDDDYRSPIKARHEEEAWIDGAYHSSEEDFTGQVTDEIPLTEEEFLRFRAELAKGKFGDIVTIMADTQFDHGLRICEVAGVLWKDVRPTSPDWSDGSIKWQRHLQYAHHRRKEYADKLAPGLKNRKVVKRRGAKFQKRRLLSKTNPFFPRSTSGLRKLFLQAVDKQGYVFVNPETGTFFTYRSLQNLYDRAFKRAGLPYTGTHIVRYGGVNDFIERYDADEETAMDLLGNESEGRYILRPSKRVERALRASKVHSSET